MDISHIHVSDVFATSATDANTAAADLYYYMGPFMGTNMRGASSHFAIAGNTMCKLFQSDTDETVCDGKQLAADISAGIRDCVWCDTFLSVVPGPDDTLYWPAAQAAQLLLLLLLAKEVPSTLPW